MALVSNLTYGLVDHQGETTRIKLRLAPVAADGANWAGLFITAITSAEAVLHAAITALTTLNLGNIDMGQLVVFDTPTVPASNLAVGANVLRFRYQDNTNGRKGRFDIPGPLAAAIPSGTDVVDTTVAEVADMISAVEGHCKSIDGNSITVLGVTYVQRRDKR